MWNGVPTIPRIYRTGGCWHLYWGGQPQSNGWNGMNGRVSNTWFPGIWSHSIHFFPAYIMRCPPLTSLQCYVASALLGAVGMHVVDVTKNTVTVQIQSDTAPGGDTGRMWEHFLYLHISPGNLWFLKNFFIKLETYTVLIYIFEGFCMNVWSQVRIWSYVIKSLG
jgi:hypothetical protein